MPEPRFYNGSNVEHEGGTYRVIGRSIDGEAVTYDLEDVDGGRVYEIAEADCEPASEADISPGPKAGSGPMDAAALSEGASVARD